MANLGLRIKKLREGRSLNQETLAKLLGVSRPTLSLIESGDRKLSAEEIKKLGEIFGISMEAFFDEKKEPQFVIRETPAEYKKSALGRRIDIPQKNLRKFTEVLLYVLGKIGAKPHVGETVLYKILYFIDFDYYERYEEQLIGATYRKNKYGPTPLEFKKVVDRMIENGALARVADRYFDYPQTKYLPRRKPDLSELSAAAKEVIDNVLDRLADKNATQISEYSHGDIPWLTTGDGDTIPYEAVFYRTPAYSVRNDEPAGDIS
jgi:transcriptional regulator with XRE-family HTH domain